MSNAKTDRAETPALPAVVAAEQAKAAGKNDAKSVATAAVPAEDAVEMERTANIKLKVLEDTITSTIARRGLDAQRLDGEIYRCQVQLAALTERLETLQRLQRDASVVATAFGNLRAKSDNSMGGVDV